MKDVKLNDYQNLTVRVSTSLLFMFCCSTAFAHVEDYGAGFASGFLHPVFGMDHFLAMVSVGVVSALLANRWMYIIPAIFVISMIPGAWLGVVGVAIPFVEYGIALSVVLLGLVIACLQSNRNVVAIAVVVALFGACHGNAHGLEMPKAADQIFYALGFLTSTAAIHILGVVIGTLMGGKEKTINVLRHMGSAMAGAGLVILSGVMAG